MTNIKAIICKDKKKLRAMYKEIVKKSYKALEMQLKGLEIIGGIEE